ncbi:MAG: acyl carrier protein [Candidatus Omnitrophica bacterium]|nr:acyl carrier protein [Candidatus Omnitrophota bacterium]
MPEIYSETLEKDLRAIVADIVEIDEGNITSEANFVEDLGMDSMMALEILATVEKKYKLKIPEENLTKMTSLKQVVELVNGLLK